MTELTHIDEKGNAKMVDVSNKDTTSRIARASGYIKVSQDVIDAIKSDNVNKGDVLGVARVAGIMAAKKTSELIPLCHTLLLSQVTVDFHMDEANNVIKCESTVKLNGQTGAEMEALTAVSTALLTIYDMCKAIDKSMVIGDIRLEEKDGGKTGHYVRNNE